MTVERPLEIELKYAVADRVIGERLLNAETLAGFRATGAARPTQHEDRYMDSADGAMARAGYATRLRIKLERVPSYVNLRHVRFDDAGLLSKTISQIMETHEYDGVRVDGLDGTAFQPGEYYLTLATWTDTAAEAPRSRATATERPWPAAAATARCGCGMWPPAARSGSP